MLACYVLWGVMPAFWKLLADVDSLYVLATRIVWSMVLTAARCSGAGTGWQRAGGAAGKAGVAAAGGGGCAITVNWGVYIWAAGHGHHAGCQPGLLYEPHPGHFAGNGGVPGEADGPAMAGRRR